jgi:hypothetical protein
VQEALHLFQDMHWAMYATVQFTVTSESSGIVDCWACQIVKNIRELVSETNIEIIQKTIRRLIISGIESIRLR